MDAIKQLESLGKIAATPPNYMDVAVAGLGLTISFKNRTLFLVWGEK